jgi:hypothetical protein
VTVLDRQRIARCVALGEICRAAVDAGELVRFTSADQERNRLYLKLGPLAAQEYLRRARERTMR